MFCSDTWWEKEISVDAVEADEENGIEAQDAYTYRKIAEKAYNRVKFKYSENNSALWLSALKDIM